MRPKISGRQPLFTEAQVRAWRDEHRFRRMVMASTRSVPKMAADAGVCEDAMRQLLAGTTYKWCRDNG